VHEVQPDPSTGLAVPRSGATPSAVAADRLAVAHINSANKP
jgi:hypothetical protein